MSTYLSKEVVTWGHSDCFIYDIKCQIICQILSYCANDLIGINNPVVPIFLFYAIICLF